MFSRLQFAFLVVAGLTALFGAACGSSGSQTDSSTSSDSSVQSAGPSPEEVVSASGENFSKIGSLRARISVESESLAGTIESEVGYQSDNVSFSRTVYTDSALGPDDFGEMLFVSADLYFRTVRGDWFVLSPWDQGTRPGELGFDGPQPLFHYVDFLDDLYNIDRLPDETIDGEDYLRYSGEIDLINLASLGLSDGSSNEGSAHADFWLSDESYLPYRVQIGASFAGSGSIDVMIEFFEFDSPITLPERPANAHPIRDLQFPEAPCTGASFNACLEASTELASIARDSCGGNGRRVCLVPLGQVAPDFIQHLVAHYRDQYGLTVTVLTPSRIPAELVNPLRGQIDTRVLMSYVGDLFPDADRDPEAVVVGVTPVDLYDGSSHYRYIFGVRGNPAYPKAVISTFRMNPETYSQAADDELLFSRGRKFLSKYIGLLYYQLPASPDPRSPLYDSIFGPDDLDRMEEPLPVGKAD